MELLKNRAFTDYELVLRSLKASKEKISEQKFEISNLKRENISLQKALTIPKEHMTPRPSFKRVVNLFFFPLKNCFIE